MKIKHVLSDALTSAGPLGRVETLTFQAPLSRPPTGGQHRKPCFIPILSHLSRALRKLDFCLCENKGPDQLRSNCEADQHLCFLYTDSTLSLLLKSEFQASSLHSEDVQASLCQNWSETSTGFLASLLISSILFVLSLVGSLWIKRVNYSIKIS